MMREPWSAPTRYFVLTLALIGLIWFVFAAQELLRPLLLAAFLAYVINPAIELVDARTRIKRRWAVLLVYLLAVVLLVLLAAVAIPLIPRQAAVFAAELAQVAEGLQRVLERPIVVMGIVIPLGNWLARLPAMSSEATPDVLLNVLQATTSNLGWLLVVLVTTYYLLLDWPKLRDWLLGLVPAERRSSVRRLYGEIAIVWRLYLHGQLRLMFFVGLLTGLSMAAVGLPGALAIGFLAGLLDVILSVGPTLVTALAAIVAFFTGSTVLPVSNFWFAVIVVGINALIQGIENVWLRPRIMGSTLKLHPAIVFIAIIGSLALAGVLTALVIIPVLSSLAIISRYIYCRLLDLDPWVEKGVVQAAVESQAENL